MRDVTTLCYMQRDTLCDLLCDLEHVLVGKASRCNPVLSECLHAWPVFRMCCLL
jgi:hypothetical protein